MTKRKPQGLTEDDLSVLITAIVGERTDDDSQLRAFREELEQLLDPPTDAKVIGEPVILLAILYGGQPRRGLTARCQYKGQEFEVSLLEVELNADAPVRPYLMAYRAWAGAPVGLSDDAAEAPPPSKPMDDIRTRNWPIYELKISLQGIRPPIWRRLRVSGNENLKKLHRIFQVAMGWQDSHLHQFVVGDEIFTDPDFDLEEGADERKIFLRSIAPDEGSSFEYHYDFGDGWAHKIEVEKILSPKSVGWTPICVAGRRACPPEDCGGPYGYSELVEALSDQDHHRHYELTESYQFFDPIHFEMEQVNSELRAMK